MSENKQYRALIINSDEKQRIVLKGYLCTLAQITFFEFENAEPVLSWLEGQTEPVDFVFLQWELSQPNADIVSELRIQALTKSSFILMITSQEDYTWVKAVFTLGDLIDNILIKPFRPQLFTQRVQAVLKGTLQKKLVALLVEDDPQARNTIRQYLVHCQFIEILEASDGLEALGILETRAGDIAIVVSDWDMPSINGIQLLKAMRQTPRYASIPFVMVTSQTSIEQVKGIQAAEMSVDGYLLKPFNLNAFRTQMGNVFQETQNQRDIEVALIEGRALLAQGIVDSAIEALTTSIKKYPKAGALHETLGDAYSLVAGNATAAKTQNLTLAAASYQKALTLCPTKSSLILKCFQALSNLGKMNEAIRVVKNGLQRFSFDDELRTKLAKLYLQSGDYSAASVELRRAVMLNPANTEAQSLLQIATSLNQKPPIKNAG